MSPPLHGTEPPRLPSPLHVHPGFLVVSFNEYMSVLHPDLSDAGTRIDPVVPHTDGELAVIVDHGEPSAVQSVSAETAVMPPGEIISAIAPVQGCKVIGIHDHSTPRLSTQARIIILAPLILILESDLGQS